MKTSDSGGQARLDTHSRNAASGDGQATLDMNPNEAVPAVADPIESETGDGQAPFDALSSNAITTGGGHEKAEFHHPNAPADPTNSGHYFSDTHQEVAAAGDEEGQPLVDIQSKIAPLIADPTSSGQGVTETHVTLAAAGDEEGQGMAGPQGDNAPLIADPTNSGQSNLDTQNDYAAAGDEEATMALTPIPPMPPLIAELIAQHRQREALHRAEKSLTLQVKANCRWLCERDKAAAKTLYDAMMKEDPHALGELFWGANLPFINAREQIKPERLRIEKRMEEISVQFPVAEWWCEESGRNLLGLAQIIGETGDLSNYADPSKLWARLCVSVENGQAKKRRRGVDNGYNATRRSVSWRVSDSLFKGQSQLVDKETGEVKREAGPYRLVYDARKVREVEKAAEEGLEVRPAAKIPAAKASLYRSEGHIHKRAMRYMEKRQLKHLWQAWRAAIEQVEPIERLPPSEETPT